MSSDYTPTPGDSVKLVGKTNPDNVLYGKIYPIEEDDKWFHFLVDAAAGVENFTIDLQYRDWTIAPWNRPVTFKPFAVVRLPKGWRSHLPHSVDGDENAEEIVLIRANMGLWTFHGCEYQLVDDQVAMLINHGAEVIFEGIDI